MKSKALLQQEAQERQAQRDARNNEQQLQLLNNRPGNSKKERAKLSR